jgi:hypothetical protein
MNIADMGDIDRIGEFVQLLKSVFRKGNAISPALLYHFHSISPGRNTPFAPEIGRHAWNLPEK